MYQFTTMKATCDDPVAEYFTAGYMIATELEAILKDFGYSLLIVNSLFRFAVDTAG